MKKERFSEIDDLRGIAIVAMIFIHVSYFYIMQGRYVWDLWNYNEFAVPVFVFCSSYLFFQKHQEYIDKHFIKHLWKRVKRLLIPYYIFLISYISIEKYFEPKKITIQYIFDSITLKGGVEINWLVLLFIMFAILMPLILYIKTFYKKFFHPLAICTIIVSFFLIFYDPPIDYRWIMWLPWSLIIFFSYYTIRFRRSQSFHILIIIISSLFFIAFSYLLPLMHAKTDMIENKYPPNLYFLSYGLFFTMLLYSLSQFHIFDFFNKPLHFLSRYSYSIYFIHYTVLSMFIQYYRKPPFTWYILLVLVFIITLSIQILINYLHRIFRYKFSK